MSKIFARFVKDESGATAIEYGLIAALIALAIMVGAGALGNNLNSKFRNIANELRLACSSFRRGEQAGNSFTDQREAGSFGAASLCASRMIFRRDGDGLFSCCLAAKCRTKRTDCHASKP